jgi:hypothetical protein
MTTDNEPIITVTVTHIPLTREVYNTLLRCLDAETFEYGKHSDLDDARHWLHYRWLVEQRDVQQAGASE